jgi:hypothetical protein
MTRPPLEPLKICWACRKSEAECGPLLEIHRQGRIEYLCVLCNAFITWTRRNTAA